MNIFIDTNIYLGFYAFSKDDLTELEKLEAIMARGDLIVLLPSQVRSEISRNRERMLSESIAKLKELRQKYSYPQVCRSYDDYREMRELKKKYYHHLDKLIDTVETDIETHSLLADNILERLMNAATDLQCHSDVLQRARDRYDLGNPPGKNGSLGDAVIWECLLTEYNGTDIYFITDDKDFSSALDRTKFKEVMLNEWQSERNGTLYFYPTLTEFLRQHFPSIDLEDEREKASLIAALSTSASFAETHRIVARLSRFADFSDLQANEIVEASFLNSQIFSIRTDRDIVEFLESVIDGREAMFDDEKLAYLRGEKMIANIDDFEEIPF